jgi:hypothetical protein
MISPQVSITGAGDQATELFVVTGEEIAVSGPNKPPGCQGVIVAAGLFAVTGEEIAVSGLSKLPGSNAAGRDQ